MGSRKGPKAVLPMSLPRLITLDQAVEELHGTVSLSTIKHWLLDGRLRSFKPGRRVLLDAEHLASVVLASERPARVGE
jgi:hypothetical protein